MTVQDITAVLEAVAPRQYQESYDNAGLITGSPTQQVTGTLICLDSTEAVLDEAIANGCNLVIAHHPIVFRGLKKITGATYVERVIMKAIKHDIAIYAAHTNLDNVSEGVNAMIAHKLGLKHTRILQPKSGILKKLYTYAPAEHAEGIRNALYAAGAGVVSDYDHCSFNTTGIGTFRGGKDSKPFIGKAEQDTEVKEVKIEVLFRTHLQHKVLNALFTSHPYEEVAYEIITLDNLHQNTGSGMIGELPHSMEETVFMAMVKSSLNTPCIRHTPLIHRPIHFVALCGGAGSFLLNEAIAAGADAFVTGDFKYHEFFDAEGRLLITDVGHYESEQYTPELIAGILQKKLLNFAPLISKVNTNPVNYF